jgi:hypothetical protein
LPHEGSDAVGIAIFLRLCFKNAAIKKGWRPDGQEIFRWFEIVQFELAFDGILKY